MTSATPVNIQDAKDVRKAPTTLAEILIGEFGRHIELTGMRIPDHNIPGNILLLRSPTEALSLPESAIVKSTPAPDGRQIFSIVANAPCLVIERASIEQWVNRCKCSQQSVCKVAGEYKDNSTVDIANMQTSFSEGWAPRSSAASVEWNNNAGCIYVYTTYLSYRKFWRDVGGIGGREILFTEITLGATGVVAQDFGSCSCPPLQHRSGTLWIAFASGNRRFFSPI